MKNIYRNYNEEDLLVAYLYMTDHTGTINDEMREAISQKFNYDEFVKKAEYRKVLIKEKEGSHLKFIIGYGKEKK